MNSGSLKNLDQCFDRKQVHKSPEPPKLEWKFAHLYTEESNSTNTSRPTQFGFLKKALDSKKKCAQWAEGIQNLKSRPSPNPRPAPSSKALPTRPSPGPSQEMISSEIMALRKFIDKEKSLAIKFNIMVIGEANSGKTCYIENFLKYKTNKNYESIHSDNETSNPQIQEYRGIREENNLKIDLGIIDTPGFNDRNLPLPSWYKLIKKELICRMEKFKQKKREINRQNVMGNFTQSISDEIDTRVHLILYFTAASTVRKEEAEFIKK
jgi:hypothetical protein